MLALGKSQVKYRWKNLDHKTLSYCFFLIPEIFTSVVFGQMTKLLCVCFPNNKMLERAEFSFVKKKKKKTIYTKSQNISPVNLENISYWLTRSDRRINFKNKDGLTFPRTLLVN